MYIYIYFETKILFGIIFEIGMTRREIIKKKNTNYPIIMIITRRVYYALDNFKRSSSFLIYIRSILIVCRNI